LHDSLIKVCTIACETLSDQSLFPENWLMKHRWNKGKKDLNVLPNGDKIIHLKVGGRTSAVVPNVQKKTGPVAGDVDEAVKGDDEEVKPKKAQARSTKIKGDDEDGVENKPKSTRNAASNKKAKKDDEEPAPVQKLTSKPTTKAKVKIPAKKAPAKAEDDSDDDNDEEIERAKDQRDKEQGRGKYKHTTSDEESEAEAIPVSKKRKAPASNGTKEMTPKKAKTVKKEAAPSSGTRRSSRK
jgi:formamidopyrimidine-DNA glycosylase